MNDNLPVRAAEATADKTRQVAPAESGAEAQARRAREQLDRQAGALSAADKAAIIIAALGPESAPHVLQGASESTIRRFARAMGNLGNISHELLERTIRDFIDELGARSQVKGGTGEAKKILRELLDDDSVSRIMDDVQFAGGRTLWEKLSNSSDQALAGFLRHEHPQTATVVLSKMRSDKAARILERLDPEYAQIVVLRLARVPRLDSEVMNLLRDVIQTEFLAVVQREQATRKPADVIGSLMSNVSGASRARLMAQLEQEKPRLAEQVQKVMFTFADLADRVEPRDAALLMKAVDEPRFLVALKMAETNAPRVKEFFLENISKRLAQRLDGDIKAQPEVKVRDGEAAQAEIVRAARELARQGDIKLIEEDDDD